MHTNTYKVPECRQNADKLKVEKQENAPPFFKKMLKGGNWVEGEIYKITFWYLIQSTNNGNMLINHMNNLKYCLISMSNSVTNMICHKFVTTN